MSMTALVTGASDRLGKEIGYFLSRLGYTVWFHYRVDSEKVSEIKSEALHQGWDARFVQADLQNIQEIDRMFDLVGKQSSLDLLINNASVFEKSRLDNLSAETWDMLFETNVRAVWRCSVKAAQIMQKTESPLIINIADSAAYQQWVEYGAYALSRASLLELTVILAKTLAPQVRVNSISPGLLLADAGTTQAQWDGLAKKSLLQKDGAPKDLLKAIEFLIKSHYITGIDLPVDGGYRWK